jgi:hypothetical protein
MQRVRVRTRGRGRAKVVAKRPEPKHRPKLPALITARCGRCHLPFRAEVKAPSIPPPRCPVCRGAGTFWADGSGTPLGGLADTRNSYLHAMPEPASTRVYHISRSIPQHEE